MSQCSSPHSAFPNYSPFVVTPTNKGSVEHWTHAPMAHRRFITRSGKRYPENEVMGVAKWRIIRINVVKGSSIGQELQNNKWLH